ncbi:MAG: enoyl-CoA hydratase/isomerase family protein [Acidimicrobiales bacterium]|nr:enoyl-CoA hydratase/isomerase family protein [Acidimicrobiales bacterium]
MERTELETIIYEKDGPIARLILNTPDKANIQTAQQVWDFDEVLAMADRDEEVKVLIVKANGNGFCAGHAIVPHEEMASVYPTTGPTPERTWKKHNYDLFVWPVLRLWEFPKATISQVHGYCLGGGTMYADFTDLTIASDDAYFQMPLAQGFGLPGAQTLVEPWLLMNWKKAYEYLYLAPTLSAQEAQEWGLINRVVPRAELESAVEETAATVARMPLTTIMTVKAGVKRAWEQMGMRVHLQGTADFTSLASMAADVQAFMRQRGDRLPREVATGKARGEDGKDAPSS